MSGKHFVDTFSDLEKANGSPIYGYQHLSVSTLEDATETLHSLVPGVAGYVQNAKRSCNQSSDLLTADESAAIYLYTMPIPFFSCLNEKLRAEDRQALKPWFAFLKLFIGAVKKLPSVKDIVWRGVVGDVGTDFDDAAIHTWWSINSCSLDKSVVKKYLEGTCTLFTIQSYHGKDISQYSVFREEKEVILLPGTRLYTNSHSLNLKIKHETNTATNAESDLYIVDLMEKIDESDSQSESNYFINLIKQKYQQDNRISRLMDPSISFPIEQSYINLSIVETAEQLEKEKKLCDAKYNCDIINAYEEIYGTKTKIEIQNIFDKCQYETKKVMVLGRAGIGKTTFCRYAAHQWATGHIWQQYDLVIWIPLRNLTESRYPSSISGIKYSIIDILKTEYYFDDISLHYEQVLKKSLSEKKILWLLDGYDEIAQNIPEHLKYVLDLLRTKQHVLTSRPYLIDLSYDVQLEITGFSDDNIEQYVRLFYDQIKNKVDNVSDQTQRLLAFFKNSPRIWGIVHVPVILELVCTVWCNNTWTKITVATITSVYDQMVEWLCRRYLKKQDISYSLMGKEDVYKEFDTELTSLESLAFHGMKSASIILSPELLTSAFKESKCNLQQKNQLLNIGLLKSFDNGPIGSNIEVKKNHYFLHLSFQEHFTARFLVRALTDDGHRRNEAIDFIRTHKYNQRFELVVSFISGLLMDNGNKDSIKLFWNALLQEPSDIIGVKHVQVIIACLEETGGNANIPQYNQLVHLIIKWINYSVCAKYNYSYDILSTVLKRCPLVVNQSQIFATLMKTCSSDNIRTKNNAYMIISQLPISNWDPGFIELHLDALKSENMDVKVRACESIATIPEGAAPTEVIHQLLNLLDDQNYFVRQNAWQTFDKIGDKAFSDPFVFRKLFSVLQHSVEDIRTNAWRVLHNMFLQNESNALTMTVNNLLNDKISFQEKTTIDSIDHMGEEVPNNSRISVLLATLSSMDQKVRISLYEVLGKISQIPGTHQLINALLTSVRIGNHKVKTTVAEIVETIDEISATDEVVHTLSILLKNDDVFIRTMACEVLGKIRGTAATDQVISALLPLLKDDDYRVRTAAGEVLGKSDDKAATDQVINALLPLLKDDDYRVRTAVGEVLGKIGGTAASDQVISALLPLLKDDDYRVRTAAGEVLRKMREVSATDEVISALLQLLKDDDYRVKTAACEVLGKMDDKAATDQVINALLPLLKDDDYRVRTAASEALGKMGGISASDQVISALLSLLKDNHYTVRTAACEVLGKMGGTAASDQVISALLPLLKDDDYIVRTAACEVLRKMREIPATDEVISALLSLLKDDDYVFRTAACEFLGKVTDKTVFDKVVVTLLMRLNDLDKTVRTSALEAIGKMNIKSVSVEVIYTLLSLLNESDEEAVICSLEILGRVGEKAADDMIIEKLIVLLRHISWRVRNNACIAARKMGRKAVTLEMMERVLDLLKNSYTENQSSALQFLKSMDNRIATNEVVASLLDSYDEIDSTLHFDIVKLVEKIFNSSPSVSYLNEDTVIRLAEFVRECSRQFLRRVSLEKFIKAFLDTGYKCWLSIIKDICIIHGCAITVTETVLELHSPRESIHLRIKSSQYSRIFREYFENWLEKSIRTFDYSLSDTY